MHYQTEFNAEAHYRHREYHSYWLQCIQDCTANLKAPNLIIGYYNLLPDEVYQNTPTGVGSYEPEIPLDTFWPEKQLLPMLAMQEADIRLEREELGYIPTALVDKVEHYIYLDQDSRSSQDLRWALGVAKEKERQHPRRQELLGFKAILAELCEELQYLEFTLKLPTGRL